MTKESNKHTEKQHENEATWNAWFGALRHLITNFSDEEVNRLMIFFVEAVRKRRVRVAIYSGSELDLAYDKDEWPYEPIILLPRDFETQLNDDPFQYAKLVSRASYAMDLLRSDPEEYPGDAAVRSAHMEARVIHGLIEEGVVTSILPFHQGLLNYNLFPRDEDGLGYDQ